MGWCQAFGPQIQDGCDHSMIAGSRSCSCPECGVVCNGKFPACSAVWAEGPQKVKLRRPGTEAAVRNPPQAAGTNGKRASEVVGELPALPRTTSGPSSQSSPSGGHDADLRRLLEEVQSAIEALPGRIAKVAGDAMRQQHKVNKQELADVWVAVHAEAEQLKKLRTKERANPQFVVDQLDARFQWLVSQLSERFVAVGNELVRIEQLVSETGRGPTPSNGPAEPAGPPNPAGAGPSATTKP